MNVASLLVCIISSGSRQRCVMLSAGELFFCLQCKANGRMRGCVSAGDLNRVVLALSSVGSGVGRGAPARDESLLWFNNCKAGTVPACKRRPCLKRVRLSMLVIHGEFSSAQNEQGRKRMMRCPRCFFFFPSSFVLSAKKLNVSKKVPYAARPLFNSYRIVM